MQIFHCFKPTIIFLYIFIKWNNLDPNVRNSDTYENFKSTILKFIRPSPNRVFEFHNPQGIKFLARLHLGLSHLCEALFLKIINVFFPVCFLIINQ